MIITKIIYAKKIKHLKISLLIVNTNCKILKLIKLFQTNSLAIIHQSQFSVNSETIIERKFLDNRGYPSEMKQSQ